MPKTGEHRPSFSLHRRPSKIPSRSRVPVRVCPGWTEICFLCGVLDRKHLFQGLAVGFGRHQHHPVSGRPWQLAFVNHHTLVSARSQGNF